MKKIFILVLMALCLASCYHAVTVETDAKIVTITYIPECTTTTMLPMTTGKITMIVPQTVHHPDKYEAVFYSEQYGTVRRNLTKEEYEYYTSMPMGTTYTIPWVIRVKNNSK